MNKKTRLFFLDPRITFLNHGSFGATPKSVMKTYQKWQNYSETQPVQFYSRQVTNLLGDARIHLANLLGVEENDISFIPNATTGINIVARSLKLSSEDVLLTTDHEYGAIDKTWKFLSAKQNFSIQTNSISVPLTGIDKILDELFLSISSKVKAISISHITSPTALILPIKQICEKAHQRGILTIIDGAHAPGQIQLDIKDLNCDFYIGNCHKWLCAPKGSAFLYTHPRVQSLIEPLVVSWGWQTEKPVVTKFIDLLEWTGTRDISTYLSVPEAISFHNKYINGEPQQYCHNLAKVTQLEISNVTHLKPLSSISGDFYSQMAASVIQTKRSAEEFKNLLYSKYNIEIPIISWKDHLLIRYSYQIYNDDQDLEILLTALKDLL